MRSNHQRSQSSRRGAARYRSQNYRLFRGRGTFQNVSRREVQSEIDIERIKQQLNSISGVSDFLVV